MPRLRIPALLLGLLLALAPRGAGAQGHPIPPSARPLHARLALADVVVVAAIESVETGRIGVAVERLLLGDAPERFLVKRSPTQPPPLAPGERAVLLLRGARPPYVLVDEPRETIRLVGEANAERWPSAIAAVLERRDDPAGLVDLYVRWMDEGPATLRDLGAKALADRSAPFQPLPDELLIERADAALDPALSIEARRAAALLALRSPAATERMLVEPVADDADEAELSIAMLSLQGGALHRSPGFVPALLRALAHDSTPLQLNASRLAASLRADPPPEVVTSLEQVVAETSDAELRREAARTLTALGAPAGQ